MPAPTDNDETTHEEQEGQELAGGQMSFFDHLEELRRRIIHSLIAVAVAFAICWYFAPDIYHLFSRLIEQNGGKLFQNTLTGSFSILFKMALMAAIFLSAPFLLAQIWLFVSPGLYKKERRYALPFIVSSSVLFVLGGLFGYFIALPFGIAYLLQLGKDLGMENLVNVSDAYDLVFALEVGMGAVFEIPAVIFLLARIGLVTGPFLLRNIKYAVLGCFIAAAVITPTGDIPNMMILAVPMIGLYVLGVIVAYVFGKKRTPS